MSVSKLIGRICLHSEGRDRNNSSTIKITRLDTFVAGREKCSKV